MMSLSAQNKVPIRLLSDGHSFYENFEALLRGASLSDEETTSRLAAATAVELLVLTPHSALVPADHLVAEDAALHLAAIGYLPTKHERVVISEAHDGAVAVMALDARLVERLDAHPAAVSYLSPLCRSVEPQSTVIALYGAVMYLLVAREGLLLAEAVAVENDADVLYYLEAIDRTYGIYNMYARAEGDSSRLRQICKRQFRRLICE